MRRWMLLLVLAGCARGPKPVAVGAACEPVTVSLAGSAASDPVVRALGDSIRARAAADWRPAADQRDRAGRFAFELRWEPRSRSAVVEDVRPVDRSFFRWVANAFGAAFERGASSALRIVLPGSDATARALATPVQGVAEFRAACARQTAVSAPAAGDADALVQLHVGRDTIERNVELILRELV